MDLKTDNVYALPDGSELVARHQTNGAILLHNPERGVASAPAYFVTGSGRLLSWSGPTSWTAADLRETGRTSQPEMKRLQLL